MNASDLRLVESAPLPYVLSVPEGDLPASGAWPLLCFLHGYGEGAPMPIRKAITLHSPLAPASSPRATEEFIVVAAQMPVRGDLWHQYANAVREIVRQVEERHPVDPGRRFLTGFSFGGNGVFDLALAQSDLWAALWPVDPTRVPREDPGRPLWLSSGEISRRLEDAFIQRLHLQPPRENSGDRVIVDQGQDHVGTAHLAYQDDRIYRWLLSKRLPST
jgi:predicted peptidase